MMITSILATPANSSKKSAFKNESTTNDTYYCSGVSYLSNFTQNQKSETICSFLKNAQSMFQILGMNFDSMPKLIVEYDKGHTQKITTT